MKFKTKITKILKIEYPIFQGALTGLGTWKFAAAVSNAGALGCYTAAVARTPEKLREEISFIKKEVGDKPFSVNLSLYMCPHQDEMFKVLIEEEVPIIETSVYTIPDEWINMMKDKGIIWFHKVTTLKHALHTIKQGADGVIIIGLEGFGFKNPNQLPTMPLVTWVRKHTDIPLIAGGGIGDPNTFLAVLALGADAAYIGSAFLLTEECPLPHRYKEKLLNMKADDPALIYRILAPPREKDYIEAMALREKVPMEKWVAMMERVLLKEPDWKNAPYVWESKLDDIYKFVSFAAAYPPKIMSVKEFINWLIEGAKKIYDNLGFYLS